MSNGVEVAANFTMRKIEPSIFSRRVPVARLYLADLEQVVALVSKPRTEVSIDHGDTEYDSLSELRSHAGNQLRKLRIHARHPWNEEEGHRETAHISVDFENTYIWLQADKRFELEFHRIEKL